MSKPRFSNPFEHRSPTVRNVNDLFAEQLTFGQRAADVVASVMGSWGFIVIQSIVLAIWIVLNIAAWMQHWDPYPFILMNLVLSMQAAYAAPIIMMSQNRQATKDRLEAHNDYLVNRKAEEEIKTILDGLATQAQALADMHVMLTEIRAQHGMQQKPSSKF